MSADPREGRILVGAIAGAHGVQGDVRLKSFCAEASAIADYGPLHAEDGSRRFDLRLKAPHKDGFIARLSGIATKEAADALKGLRLYADRDRLPHLPDDEFYHADLIGLPVLDTGGRELGRVQAVQNFGAGDMLEIFQPGQKSTILLPFTAAVVPTVDLTAGRIIADPPEETEE